MAAFARSFKPPAYLTTARPRPGMPGRSLSSSSDLSISSNTSGRTDDTVDVVSSHPGTPTNYLGSSLADGERASTPKNASSDAFAVNSPRSSFSRPIAIELPKFSSAPAKTPPQPLSARGDIPGGYFPLHEDPRTRVHRPHPFQHRATDSSAMHAEHKPPRSPSSNYVAHGTNMPVASYMPPGFYDSPLPMGKYYPSNYEKRTGRQSNIQTPIPSSPSLRSDSQVPRYRPGSSSSSISEDETRRKIQQYQRDMIMQATMALGNTSGSGSQLPTAVTINGVELRISSAAAHKPKSPRLVPLGSPGPVTPMELESASGSYLDKGHGADKRVRESLAPPLASPSARAK